MIGDEGIKVAYSRHLVNAHRRLRRNSKLLSRKKAESANLRKARLRIATHFGRIASDHADFQHKLSRQIIVNNQAKIVETLKLANLRNPKAFPAISEIPPDLVLWGNWPIKRRNLASI